MLKVFVMWDVEWINLIAGNAVGFVFNHESYQWKGNLIFMCLISVQKSKFKASSFDGAQYNAVKLLACCLRMGSDLYF